MPLDPRMLIASPVGPAAPARHDIQMQADIAIFMRGVKGPGRRHDAELLDEFPRQRSLGRFACMQMPARHIPTSSVSFVGGTQSQQYAFIAHDQRSNAFTGLVLAQ